VSSDADDVWLGERLLDFLNDGQRSPEALEFYLELETPPGGTPWHEVERLVQRDDLMAKVAAEFFPDPSPGIAAKALLEEWGQYRRQAHADDLSRGYSLAPAGSLRSRLFELALLGGPPGRRRVRDLLIENIERVAG